MIDQRKIIHPEYYTIPFTIASRPRDPHPNGVDAKLFTAVATTSKTQKALRVPQQGVAKSKKWSQWLRISMARRGYRVHTAMHMDQLYVWAEPLGKRKPTTKSS